MRVGIAIPRAASITPTWTTIHLARAALDRGHRVRFVEPWDFEVDPTGRLVARAHAFDAGGLSADQMVESLQERTADRRFVDLAQLDLLLMRVAPLSMAVITFGRLVKRLGVPVVNDPDGMVTVAHKAWLASIPDLPTPATLVTRSRGAARLFAEQRRHGVVVKPARGSGGHGITRVRRRDDRGLDRAFDAAKARGDGYVVVQDYLPQASQGEKRLLWLDGDLIGGYLRHRAPGDFRHNLRQGGQAEALTLTDADRAMAARISPHLIAAGIRFAGLDVIGDYLTEVNALNPGGTFHVHRLTGNTLADTVLARLEQTVTTSSSESKPWAHPAP